MPPIFSSKIWKRILIAALVLVSVGAHTQLGSPFETRVLQHANFHGHAAKAASLIAIVIGGYQFAHGESGAKKVLAEGTAMHDQ
jgi:hypothetical protein